MFRFLAKTSLQAAAVRSSVTPSRVAPLATRSFTSGSGDSKVLMSWIVNDFTSTEAHSYHLKERRYMETRSIEPCSYRRSRPGEINPVL